MKSKILNRVVDGLIIFAMLFGIALLIYVFKGSTSYWTLAMKDVVDLNQKMFWISLLIAIVYSIYNFIAGFIKEIAKVLKTYNNKGRAQ